jgi:hypothetical protein
MECILEAAALFEAAYPQKMISAVKRLLSRAFLAKLSKEGEEVITESNEIVLQKPKEVLFTREALTKFADLLGSTTLKRVQESPKPWDFVAMKASRLGLEDLQQRAVQEAEIRRRMAIIKVVVPTDDGSAMRLEAV